MKIIVNGKLYNANDPIATITDRGLLLGDGLFETLRVDNNTIQYAEKHFNRLQKSAKIFSIPLPFSYPQMLHMMKTLLKENGLSNASIRLTLTRGPGPRGILPPEKMIPQYFIAAQELLTAFNTSTAILVDHIRRNEYSPTSQHKTLNYFDNIVAAQYAKEKGAQFAILKNTKANIACAHCANIFLNIDGKIYTPRTDDGALPGIIRSNIIETENITCRTLPASSLKDAQHIFLTNSLMNKVSVDLIDAC